MGIRKLCVKVRNLCTSLNGQPYGESPSIRIIFMSISMIVFGPPFRGLEASMAGQIFQHCTVYSGKLI